VADHSSGAGAAGKTRRRDGASAAAAAGGRMRYANTPRAGWKRHPAGREPARRAGIPAGRNADRSWCGTGRITPAPTVTRWPGPMTEWHLGWQRAVPPERREVVIGPHRADIVTASGGVAEIQHSPVSPAVISEREEFYGERMAWIFDATQPGITVRPSGASGTRLGFAGSIPRWSIGACRRPVLLSTPGKAGSCTCPGWARLTGSTAGAVHPRLDRGGWLRDGTRWERI
jgi:hypothetical protein